MVCAKFGKNCSSKKFENVKTFTDGQTDEKETKKTRKKIKNKQTNKNQKKKTQNAKNVLQKWGWLSKPSIFRVLHASFEP